MNDVVFIRQQGGLARTAPGEDHISAFISYGAADSIPALVTQDEDGNDVTTERDSIIQPVFSLIQAEDLGITEDGVTAVWHYHIAEFFRVQPEGELWLGIFESDDDFEQIINVQMAAEGRIRQAAVYTTTVLENSIVTGLQTQAGILEGQHMPLSILLGANIVGLNLESEGPDLNSGTSKNVSVIVGQDAGGRGAELFAANPTTSITCVGAALGAVSRAAVNESIAWVQEFNVDGGELSTLALANGTLISSLPRTAQDAIGRRGYIFLIKHIGIGGSYFNDSHTAVDSMSDFTFIENNRTIDKAIRGLRSALLPQLSSPVFVADNGTLSFDSIGFFESLANRPLEVMRIDGEVSNYDVFIDPNQQILSDSILRIQVSIIPVGVARRIEVSVGFTLSIA